MESGEALWEVGELKKKTLGLLASDVVTPTWKAEDDVFSKQNLT